MASKTAAARQGKDSKRRSARSTASPTPRGSLSREAILCAALEVADREGLEKLTQRKIAAELGVSPMGLYRHFQNKSEIVSGLLDHVIGNADVTSHAEEDWEDWVRQTFQRMRQALCQHPGVIPLLGSNASFGKNALGVMERILGALRSGGLDGVTAARTFHTAIGYMIGSVAVESAARRTLGIDETLDNDEERRQARLFLEKAPQPQYPNLVELAPHLALIPSDEEFDAGLCQILSAARASSS